MSIKYDKHGNVDLSQFSDEYLMDTPVKDLEPDQRELRSTLVDKKLAELEAKYPSDFMEALGGRLAEKILTKRKTTDDDTLFSE